MTGRRRKPKPYLDTNIILDYIRGRNHESVLLMETLRRKKLHAWTSYYTLLELIDKEQENAWIGKRVGNGETFDQIIKHRFPRKLTKAELEQVFGKIEIKFWKPFIDDEIVYFVIPNDQSWDNVLELMKNSNISIVDAIHLDAAVGSNCNVFISNDGDLVKIIKDMDLIPASGIASLDRTLSENRILPIF